MARRLKAGSAGFEEAFHALLHAKRETTEDVSRTVSAILAAVREQGDAALCAYTAEFDRIDLAPAELSLPLDRAEAAYRALAPDLRAALDLAAQRIESFHAKQVPADHRFTDEAGVELGWRWRPVAAAGLYVPGGTAAYPSSVLMNAIPARAAGVERVVMVVPTPDGVVNDLVLAAAHLGGIDEIYRVGGAQAIGALAYGTPTIAPVDLIVGPGNAYVAAAKRYVFGTVGIDMIAGPSEILVVADEDNNPDWIAADLLSQAEHDPSSQSILMTPSKGLADEVAKAMQAQLTTLPRAEIAGASWADYGAIIEVPSLDAAVPLIDRLAPEHLELAVADPDSLAERIRNAGSIFLGPYTPEAIGDYIGGPNHVLPTARSARFASGLSVFDFLKRSTLLKCTPDALRALGPSAMRLATAEGLDAHGRSIGIRLNL
ncbi:MAG: histidinol dehydrogenase [Pseudomonadota bacterium]